MAEQKEEKTDDRVWLTVWKGQEVYKIRTPRETSLLKACQRLGLDLQGICGGRRTCGKCLVQLLEGQTCPLEEEKRHLTKEQLAAGWRLACCQSVREDLTVRLPEAGESPQEPGKEKKNLQEPETEEKVLQETDGRELCRIAVDLGSTTLAAVLLNGQGKILASRTAANSQRIYGADVLSRIKAANEGEGGQLRLLICQDMQELFASLLSEADLNCQVREIAIAGNTVMLHLLRGYSCQGLGQAPFQPVSLEAEDLSWQEVFGSGQPASDYIDNACQIWLLPGLSAFVGADISAGLCSSGFLDTGEDSFSVFADLGTNGELAVGCGSHFLTASTAAGPAFEGGGLSCGMPGIGGAISRVEVLFHRFRIFTIGQKAPLGICGTGALDAVAALRQEGLLDSDGLLADGLFEGGLLLAKTREGKKLCLTQEDIRQIQLAKAAVRAGMEILSERYLEENPSAVLDRVYLSGGFGLGLSAKTAVAVGLIPADWEKHLSICANTSLQGAIYWLTSAGARDRMKGLSACNTSILLADDPLFSDKFVEQMAFP